MGFFATEGMLPPFCVLWATNTLPQIFLQGFSRLTISCLLVVKDASWQYFRDYSCREIGMWKGRFKIEKTVAS